MSLRTKIVMILVVVVGLFTASAYAIQVFVVAPTFTALERDEARKDLLRGVQAVEAEIGHLSTLAFDWSAWDDTYEFVQDGNAEFVDSNLVEASFTGTGLNLIYICDLAGRVVWGRSMDLATGEYFSLAELPEAGLPADHVLLGFEDVVDANAGILMTERGPLLVAARAISTSEQEGPIRGAVIMGRFLDAERLQDLVDRTQVSLTVWPIAEDGSVEPSEADALAELSTTRDTLHDGAHSRTAVHDHAGENLQVYAMLEDLSGRPALLMRADVPRDITARGADASRIALVSILVAGAALLAVLLVLLSRVVTSPVSQLTHHASSIAESGDLGARLDMRRGDEIGVLARAFDAMVRQVADTRKQLLAQSYDHGRSETAAGVLHNTRNALSPLVTKLDRLGRELRSVPLQRIEGARRELEDEQLPADRRRDLEEFVSLAGERALGVVERGSADLENVWQRATEIQRILDEQGGVPRAEAPQEVLHLRELVEDALAMVPGSQRERLEVVLGDAVAKLPALRAPRLSLLQVLANLFGNAADSIEAAGRDSGQVTIEADLDTSADSDAEILRMRVSDDGRGIEPADLERLFERGFTTNPADRTGLGLHWCANALANFGGALRAESGGVGTGATFTVEFPCSRVRAASAAPAGSAS